MPTSFKPGFTFTNQPTSFNAQRFATFAEAERSAWNRFQRWTQPTGYVVVESNDPVNYRWDEEKGDVLIKDVE